MPYTHCISCESTCESASPQKYIVVLFFMPLCQHRLAKIGRSKAYVLKYYQTFFCVHCVKCQRRRSLKARTCWYLATWQIKIAGCLLTTPLLGSVWGRLAWPFCSDSVCHAWWPWVCDRSHNDPVKTYGCRRHVWHTPLHPAAGTGRAYSNLVLISWQLIGFLMQNRALLHCG